MVCTAIEPISVHSRESGNPEAENSAKDWVLASARTNGIERRLSSAHVALVAQSHQKVCPGGAEPFDVGRAALLEHEMIRCKIAEHLAYLDAPALAMRFHARGRVHCITPDVVGEARVAND